MRARLLISVLASFLLISCQQQGTIPEGPVIVDKTTWTGLSNSIVTGPISLSLVIEERSDATVIGNFAMAIGRSGTLIGRRTDASYEFRLNQSAPCAATFDFKGSIMSDGRELSGRWSSRECDGRAQVGVFALVKAGSFAAPRTAVTGLYRVSFRYGPTHEDGALDVFQSSDGTALTGIFANSAGIFSGRMIGLVSGDTVNFILERSLPCIVSRSTTAVVSNLQRNWDGVWTGADCLGLMISAGVFEARR